MKLSLAVSFCIYFSLTFFGHYAVFGQTRPAVRMTSLSAPLVQQSPTTPEQAAVAAKQAAATPVAAGDAAASAGAKETPEQVKVKLLLKAKFDRSTASVLKAWSDKPKDDEPAVKKQKDKPLVGVVKVAYEGFAVVEFEELPKFKVGDVVKMVAEDATFGSWKLLSMDGNRISAKQVPDEKKTIPTTPDPSGTDKETTAEKPDTNQPEQSGEQETDSSSTSDTPSEANGSEEKSPGTTEAVKTGMEVAFESAVEEEKKPDPEKQMQAEVDAFERDVTLGNWTEVKKFLSEISVEEADKVYAHLLKSLATAPKAKPGQPQPGGQRKKAPSPQLSPEDIYQIAEAAPKSIQLDMGEDEEEVTEELKTDAKPTPGLPPGVALPPGVSVDQLPPGALEAMAAQAGGVQPVAGQPAPGASPAKTNHIDALATLMVNSRKAGHDFAEFYEKVKAGTRHFGGDDPVKKLTAADLFMKSNLTEYVEEFLPALDQEGTDQNLPALKIWSKLALQKHAEKSVAEWLEKAWKINQWIVGTKDLKKEDKELALTNLLQLSSKVDKEIGVEWINASFTDEPERGKTILTNLGTKSADMALKSTQVSEKTRFDLLSLQNESVEKLIELSPDQAKDWRPALTLLATNWLQEAGTSLQYSQQTNRGGSYMEIDMYGNYYWVNQNRRQTSGRRPRPIKISDILEVAPSVEWQDLIHSSLHTNLRQTKAKLHLRVNEEDKAFPFIEEIAPTHPVVARDLVHEFLTTWTQNHDPNSNKRRRNPYIYFYGFDRKAEAIPLTRSKQERNLNELSKWVARIRKLPIEDVDEQLLADAFTNCHSSAEVFELERFREVFGDLEKLKPETIAAICQKMRASLAAAWRDIRTQEQKQTNRREPEVQQEVLNGYLTATTLIAESLTGSPDNWQLHLAKAMLMYDENAYAQTVQKSSEFSDKRDASFEQFQVAADKYADVVTTLDENKQSTEPYDYWFYASLGACDLGKITDKTVPDLKQYEKIRVAMEALPGLLAESHLSKFANNLFTRMSPIKPEIKFRYLRGGFEIVGEHPRAWEARNLYNYYKDLVHEIKLTVDIDGADKVGHDQSFGAYVNILHTNEIERESGGFGKYVQNQNAMMYAYNYGRPTEDYRDKFNDSVEQALGEHFEIQNITFQNAETMESRQTAKPGWKVTPYAYVLLKPKGPEVDRIAPLKLDLDFLDTSGYVVIPIESPALVIDCSLEDSPMRPVSDVKITQTLDERQASDGKLIVEISASGKGLVPDLDQLIDIERDSFEVVSVDDQGVLPTEFDAETNDIQILSDRSWTVEYKAKDTAEELTSYSFSNAKLEDAKAKFQRYEDADLVEVAQTIDLEKNYKAFSWAFLYWLIPAIVLGLVGVAGLVYVASRPAQVVAKRFNVPEDINPFTVLTLLKDIKERNGISNEKGVELEDSINRIEEYYFGEKDNGEPEDLEELAKVWVRQAK